jgi:hypothetical protein
LKRCGLDTIENHIKNGTIHCKEQLMSLIMQKSMRIVGSKLKALPHQISDEFTLIRNMAMYRWFYIHVRERHLGRTDAWYKGFYNVRFDAVPWFKYFDRQAADIFPEEAN